METWLTIIRHSLLFGALISAFLTAMIIGSLAYNAELWLNDYPKDVRAKYGPPSEKTRRQKGWFMLFFFLPLVALLVIGIIQLRALAGGLSFLPVFLFTYIMFMVFNLVDLLIIDWLVLWLMRPRFAILPGTEGMAGYNDWVFPLVGFIKGSIGLVIGSAVIAGITVAIDRGLTNPPVLNGQGFFHLAFVILFLAFSGLRAYYHRQATQNRGQAEYREGRLHTALRLSFGIPFMLTLLVYMFWPGLLAWAQFELPGWIQWLGLAMGSVSLLLLVWVHRTLGDNFSTTLHVREEHTLVTGGPYRYVRHPMYTVLYLFLIGVLLLTRNAFIGGVLLVAQTLVVGARINHEERVMLEKFGEEYRQYMRRTGRFLPRLVRAIKSKTAVGA